MLTPVPDLIYGALAEIRVARGGDVIRAEDQALCLTFLNEILERLAVTPSALFARQLAYFPLAPLPAVSQTIGPTGTIVVARRPVRIARATVLLAPGNTTRQKIQLYGPAWWAGIALPYLTAPIPEGLYYNPAWPNGELYFYPLPSSTFTVELGMDTEIVAVAATDAIDLPQGYSELLRLWTAKKAAPAFAREFSTASQTALTEVMGDLFGANLPRVPDLDTRDGGVPATRGGVYDYRTGQVG